MTINYMMLIFALSVSSAQINKFTEELDLYFKAVVAPSEPGISVLIMKSGKEIYGAGYGIADLESREKITNQTVFNTGSISKTFVAYGILLLADDGKINLDDDLYTYFPTFKNKDLAKKIKLYHLLNHTSGLIDSRNVNSNKDFFLTADDEDNFAPLLKNETNQFEPGERFSYSNPAYNGLALIIEKVTKKRWQDFIIERIFKPASMMSSTITDGSHPEKSVAHAYQLQDMKFSEYDYGEYPTFNAAGNGGVWSTVFDLYRYEIAQRNHVFTNARVVELARTVHKPDNWGASYEPFVGYTWWQKKVGDFNETYHTGGQGGFYAYYGYIAEKDVFVSFLINRNDFPFDFTWKKIYRLLIKYNWLD